MQFAFKIPSIHFIRFPKLKTHIFQEPFSLMSHHYLDARGSPKYFACLGRLMLRSVIAYRQIEILMVP